MLKGSVGAAVGFWSPSMAKAAGQTSTAVLDSTWSTEINGQLLEKGGECKGARGNDCDVWIPPEIPDSPEELVGEIGVVTSKVFLDLRILKDYNKEVLEDGAVRGRLVIGLYGNDAPKTVAHFLQFFPKIYGEGPAYATGSFFRHEPGKYLEGRTVNDHACLSWEKGCYMRCRRLRARVLTVWVDRNLCICLAVARTLLTAVGGCR